jgi:hypothetical protein
LQTPQGSPQPLQHHDARQQQQEKWQQQRQQQQIYMLGSVVATEIIA